MPRYHFNVYDGRDGLDLEGTDLAGVRAAGLEALRFAGDVIKAEATRLLAGNAWRMDVTDERGQLVLRLDVKLTGFPMGAFAP